MTALILMALLPEILRSLLPAAPIYSGALALDCVLVALAYRAWRSTRMSCVAQVVPALSQAGAMAEWLPRRRGGRCQAGPVNHGKRGYRIYFYLRGEIMGALLAIDYESSEGEGR